MVGHRRWGILAATVALVFCVCDSGLAQIGYGVNAAGSLFSFDTDIPAVVTTIGPVGFLPEGIDFQPGTATLYAIDIGPNTSQLYTINIATGAATPVGSGFNSSGSVSGVPYNLTANQTYGFDFNPKTLQSPGDNSMRIRLIGTSGVNLRLNSLSGQIAAVDTSLLISPTGASPFADAAAYINNIPESAGTTALYDMDSRNDKLYLQNPPNNGTLTEVGPFGVTIDASANISFDIYTTPGDADPTIGGDFGFAVLQRPDSPPLPGPMGAYQLYDVDLATGQISHGALVGPAAAPFDFVGGFAVLPVAVPEPTSFAVFAGAAALLTGFRRRND
jgi:hypothetical protein